MRMTPEAFHTEAIELLPEHTTRTAVSRVECPTCGALRTLHPQGSTLQFPSHPKRQTPPPREDVRWIKRESLWELVPAPQEGAA